jgi:hypothetical protein
MESCALAAISHVKGGASSGSWSIEIVDFSLILFRLSQADYATPVFPNGPYASNDHVVYSTISEEPVFSVIVAPIFEGKVKGFEDLRCFGKIQTAFP